MFTVRRRETWALLTTVSEFADAIRYALAERDCVICYVDRVTIAIVTIGGSYISLEVSR